MAHGGDVWRDRAPGEWLDFSANLRPEGPPEWVFSAMAAAIGEARYYPDPAMRRERAALAEYLGIDAACVLPTAGGVSALRLAMALNAPGVLLYEPCFSEYAVLAGQFGRPVCRASLLDGAGGVSIPEATLPEGFLVCFGNPNNPVGAAFSRAEMEELLGRVEAAGGWLLVDEAFIEYCPEYSVRDWIPGHERLLVAGSMTKILGIPGARLGYLCAAAPVLSRLAARQLPWEVNCFAGAVARALPGHGADIRATAEQNARRRDTMRRALEGLGADVYPSDAPYLLARFDRPVAPFVEALRERGMLVRVCMDFAGIDDGRHLRLAVKDDEANERLIAALGEVL